jgi:tRNA A37 threonylcarbamoyladenosine dehydratase
VDDRFSRSELLLGKDGMDHLSRCSVAVFGLGGVGSHLAATLARGGIGHIALVDHDVVCLSNINRQVIASSSTVGLYKTQAMKDRILDINPRADIMIHTMRYGADSEGDLSDLSRFDYVADAIDTVSSKLHLIGRAVAASIPVISCMGCGNKLDPTLLEVGDIAKTSVCPLARVMRRELRARGITRLKVVYSKEDVMTRHVDDGCMAGEMDPRPGRHPVVGSVSFVPPVAGLIMAGEIIKDLLQKGNEKDGNLVI